MYIFIVGSPRSGTTMLADLLSRHRQIAGWNEPVFVLDHHYRDRPDDSRTAIQATPEVAAYIRREFKRYRRHNGRSIIFDKSPVNSLKIPFLNAIFPDAQFFHMLRDGRDATLSINSSWNRIRLLQGRRIFSAKGLKYALHTFKNAVGRQPLLRHKIAALHFEFGGFYGFIDRQRLLHRTKWGGRVCWGPRFTGWESAIDSKSVIEFNAMQWAYCVEEILDQARSLAQERFFEIRYEKLLQEPEAQTERILSRLGLPVTREITEALSGVRRDNWGKWQSRMSEDTRARVGPILMPMLRRTGYETSDAWYTAKIK